jgi:hypothetical protein
MKQDSLDITKLCGSAQLFADLADFGDIENQFEEYDMPPNEEEFEGYKLSIRAALHVLGEQYLMSKDALGLESDFLFGRSRNQLGDFDKVQSSCEAAGLARTFNRHNRRIADAEFDEVEDILVKSVKELAQPVFDLVKQRGELPSEINTDMETIICWSASHQCHTYLIDNKKNIPWAFVTTNFDNLWDAGYQKHGVVNGYILGIESLLKDYTSRLDTEYETGLSEESIRSWSDLDQKFGELRDEFLRPINNNLDINYADSVIFLDKKGANDYIEHLYEDDRVPVIGKEEQLKQLLFWEYATILSDNSLSHSALFGSILDGMISVRERIDQEKAVFIRRFVHPDEIADGNNYSYALRVDAPHLLGGNMMKGWAVFIRVGTDYSGYGSTQYELIEELLSEYESKSSVDIEEMELGEKELEELLEENHGELSYEEKGISNPIPTYAGMTLREISGEGKKVEFKREFPGTDKISKEIAALANTEGGVILIGVDDEGEVVGLDDPQGMQSRIEGLTISSSFRPPIYPEFHTLEPTDEDSILLIEVPDLDRPCAYNYRYYARVGTSVEKQVYEELKQRFE